MNMTIQFYLALENSICADYITEKFWKVLNYNVIPIVLNGANMSAIAPKHSYIDIKDFSTFSGATSVNMIYFKYIFSIIDFAQHIIRVSQDDSLFASYFWWRDYYASPGCDHYVACSSRSYVQAYCSLCQALHSKNQEQHIISDIYKWWVHDAECKFVSAGTNFGQKLWKQ